MSLKLILNKLTSMVLVICMLLSLAAPAVGEEPLTQPTEETVYSDGSTVYVDGTVVYADGTIVYADGTTVHADGTTVNADGTTIYPDGTAVYPDGKMVYADGTTVYPDGTTVYADGTVVYANGTIVYADGTTVHADGTTVNADGTTVYPDGTTVYADGTMVYVNGTVAYPDGRVVYTDGTTLNPDGTTVYPDGTTVYADGTTVYSDGTTVYPDRTTVYPDGTTVYPDGTTVYPDGTTNSVLEEEQVPLAVPELNAADPVIETPENPEETEETPADPAAPTDPAAETQPVTDGEAAAGEEKTPPVIPGKEAELAEEAENAEKSENTESQESTEPAEPTESEPEEEPEENIEGQTEENPEETTENTPEDTDPVEEPTEETTEDATEDTAEDTAEDEPEETTENPAAPAEELPLRTLTVSAGQMAFRDQYLNPTEPVLWSGSIWNWLYGSAIEPSYIDGRVTVEISGHLPETVTARAMFIEFADPSAARNDERALMLLDVALLDESGAVYVPTEKLHVSVSAGTIYGAAESGEPLAAYFDDSYDGIGAAGDIKVRLDENIDGSRLAYVPEQNEALRFWEAGGRLVSTGNGAVEFDENRFPFRFVLSAQQEAREEEQAEIEQENVVKDVMLSGTLIASDGYTYEVSVSYPANCGIPVGAQLSVEELIVGTDAYWDYINQSAAELGISPADLSLARAFDISLVDPETGVHYQPTQDVQVSITLISTPVNTEEEIEVLHFDDEAGQVQAMDVALNGETIEFETNGFSVFVVLQRVIEKNLTAGDGNTYHITVDYDSTSGIPDGVELEVAEIREGDAGYDDYVARSAAELGENVEDLGFARAFDISLVDPATGVRYQPNKNVKVSIQVLNENLSNYESVDVVHFGNDVEVMNASVNGEAVEFATDGFSVYVVCAYTVDFHWGDYTYSIAGENEILLSQLLEKLGVTEITLSDVVSVSFSNPNYISIEQTGSDWLLRSLAPFSTEEVLVLTLANGRSVEIKVTDDPTVANSWPCNATNSDNVTCTLYSNGDMVISGTGSMKDYTASPWVKDTPWYKAGVMDQIQRVVVADGITHLGTNTFTRAGSLVEIDASECTTLNNAGTDLFKVDSGNSHLTRVDFSGNTNFTSFENNAFQNVNTISYLDISDTKMTSLVIFDASKTAIQTLKANNCTNITGSLDLSGYTSLTTLELSGCTNLTGLTLPASVTTLNVSGSGLTSLDLSACTSLTTLDVSGCTGLTSLTVPSSVTSLNVSDCTSLTSLDVSDCTGLTSLTVPSSVTSLDVSGCTGLTALDLSSTSLTNIDVSNNANLTALKLPATVSALNINGCENLVLYFDGKTEDLPENLIPASAAAICWGDYTYTIQRNTTVTLTDIFTACGITAITGNDVASISSSDESSLQVSGLTVKNLIPFTDTLTLALTLNNDMTGQISIVCSALEESGNLNLFLDDGTVYSYEGETDAHSLSDAAIINQGDKLNLSLSFSEIPEGQDGARQMALLAPMTYTFPAGLTVTDVPETVTINVQRGEDTIPFTASVDFNEETGVLTITGDYGDQGALVSASTEVSFTVPVTVQPGQVPGEYDLGNNMTLSAVGPRNVKVSISSGEYDKANRTIQYTVTVEAENDLDFEGYEYPVAITDLTTGDSPALQFVSGSYTYTQENVPEGASATRINETEVVPGTPTEFTQFPLTVAHMYAGDTITLTYTAKVLCGYYNTGSGQTEVQNTVTIFTENPSNIPEDDTAFVANAIPYEPLAREYRLLDGSWAYWQVTVNPNGYTLNGGSNLTLEDTFDDKVALDAEQSIDYNSIKVNDSGVTYDYSGSTGTFIIPDNTPVTITYRTRITAQPGEKKTFRGTAVLKDTDGNTIATSTAGVTGEGVVIYPSAADVTGSDYMVRLYVYAEGQMQTGIEGVTFILLDANQRALEYKLGENKGQPVTFTTGSDGYVNIELQEEDGDITIEKNTGYYLEMMQAVEGYQKDNTLYGFMITDDPTYSSGGFYKYFNGDTMKVRLYPSSGGLNVSIRFSGSYALREDQKNNVTAVLQRLDDDTDSWVEVERHPYTDSQQGAIKFETVLYDAELTDHNIYRVIEENESPWDLPEGISLTTRYYCMVNDVGSDSSTEPREFWVENAEDSVNVVIDNRYEEAQLTIVKMDKQTGKVLPGAVFSVYKIEKGAASGNVVTTYTTDEAGELVIRGGESFESETLYGIKETTAPEDYLLPLKEEWHYFYFCNDEYLEPSIRANLPEDATAINLTTSGDRITIDNQKEIITIPVMKLWQGPAWPNKDAVVVGLYQSVEGGEAKTVDDKKVTLTTEVPYNNTAFTDLPSRDGQGRNIIYSIKEESINGQNPLAAGYVQEYGISSAGVYIVRNKPATTLTVSKEWYQFNPVTGKDEKVEDESELAAQSSVTFDVYRSTTPFADSTPDDGITNADMTDFVSSLTKVRENLSFGAEDKWTLAINDLDKQDDLGNRYYYYVLETVPSFGTELYVVGEENNEENNTVTIQNKIAPTSVNLTVTKAALVRDPRPESLNRDFEFTLKLTTADGSHPIRSWQVYTDPADPNNNLITDWNGEAKFTLKPTDPDQQTTPEASIRLALPVGVKATVTETYNPEYTVDTISSAEGNKDDENRSFSYVTKNEDGDVTLTYTNTLHVICKVVDDHGVQTPFETLKRALNYIQSDPDSFTSPWTIYMLEDYTIPATDGIVLEGGKSLTLTTASTTDEMFPFKGGEETDRAVITRGEVGDSMLKNAGTLTLENICLDGGNVTAAGNGGLVNSTGTLNLNDKTTLRNSAADGKGGAVYAEGTVNIVDGAEITGNSAPSASALYLKGTLNMPGGEISGNTGAADGAVVLENTGDMINLSGNPVIIGNTNAQGKAANLYIGVNRDDVVNVVSPGLAENAQIGITAMDGHMLIGEQFATAEFEQTANLNRFINDVYGYHGKLKDGTSTNVVWDGLTVTIKKIVDPVGANPNDRFTITLTSTSIIMSSYVIDGTLDYTVTAARPGRSGRIVLRNVKADDEITISPLPVGEYVISETASNYEPTYTFGETGSEEEPESIEGGTFTAENDSSITVKNTRKLAPVKLTKTLDDRLANAAVDFNFTVKLTDADGTAISGFTLAEGISTNASGGVNFTMSPTDADNFVKNLEVPVGATMTITETVDPNYRITASAKTMPTMPAEGEGSAITDADTDNDNVFAFTVTDDGADVTFANVRKMAEIELSKTLVGKVSKEESFEFTLTLTNGNTPVADYMVYRDESNPENNITTNANGVATITLTFVENETDPKSIPLTIPEGTKLVVAETEVKKNVNGTEQAIYNTKYSVNGGSAASGTTVTINSVSDTDQSIAFTNTRKTNTITVKNTVKGYSGNTDPFTYTATVTDGGEDQDDYDANDFEDGVMTFELTNGQTRTLTVPYGATLTVAEGFIVGYSTTVKRGGAGAVEALSDTFVVTANMSSSSPLLFTNNQLIGLQLVNNTSSALVDVTVTVEKDKIYRVNENKTGQELIGDNKTATLSIAAGETAVLEIEHDTSKIDASQKYTVNGNTPALGFYYTIKNEPSFHEYADPAILRVYNANSFEVKGRLRYSVSDSTVTFTEQLLVSFDSNGGTWTSEMEGYKDRDGDRKVYQKAVTSGETVSEPDPKPVYPTAEGIPFLGWTTDEDFAKEAHKEGEDISEKAYDFDTPVTEPITLYAVWAKPEREGYVVTVKNGFSDGLPITATLTKNDEAIESHTLSDGLITNPSGEAEIIIDGKGYVNLAIPYDAKLVLKAGRSALTTSGQYVDDDSAADSFTIKSVTRDGTVTFAPGICKITDASGIILYDNNGKPAVYTTLASAFTAYDGTLYTDASHMTTATQAAVKMLVDEYEISSKHTFPNKNMTLTTAGKDDADFPFLGMQDRATLYRDSFATDSLFAHTKASEITLTNIILDGRSVSVGAGNGGLINVNKSGAMLTIDTGTTLRNVVNNNSLGGAIYMNNGTLNVSAGLFSNLHAKQGGAIYVNSNAILNLSGTNGSTHFEECCAEVSGGAIEYRSSSALTIDGGSDNGFMLGTDGNTQFDGEGKKIEVSNPGIVFNSCIAKDSNEGNGGAIYIISGGSASIWGCSFVECSARVNKDDDRTRGGGAIAAKNVNSITVSNCTFYACDTLTTGGAVFAKIKDGTSMTVNNCIFRENSCKGQGGGIGVYQQNENSKTTALLTVNGCCFENCSSGTQNGSGGAIQSYLPCMSLNNSDFTDCWAGKEGGGINNYFGSGYLEQWNGSFMTITGCVFTRCRAEDRFQVDIVVHYGGAINTKVKTVSVDGCIFEDCVSTLRDGGALHLGGCGDGTSATIMNSTFTGCTAKKHGGAVFSSAETLEISGSMFYGCMSTADCGGAVYHGMNCRSEQNIKKETKITYCEFKQGCSAAINGSAVWTAAQNAEITNCTIEGCASGSSGAIYLSEKDVKINTSGNKETGTTDITVSLPSGALARGSITNGSITGCEAASGSAVYVGHSAIFSGGLSVTGNTVSDVNSGAIQTVNTGKLYFEGDVVVKDNACSAESTYDHDVLMQIDGNTIINTTSVGLGSGANIGVYVSDPNSAYVNHGLESQPFGTYGSSNYLDAFFNDRDGELYGCQMAASDTKIYWGMFVCKITDGDGNTLTRPNGRDAVYQRLSQALDEFNLVIGGKAVYIKMLVEDYAIRQNGQIENFPDADITLTTETYTGTEAVAGKYDGKHPYRGTGGTFCTISRTNSENPLFSLSTEGATFQLKDITLDGRKNRTATEGDYKLITAIAGEIIVNSGTTLQYAKGDIGAAISGVAVTINGSYDAENKEPTVKITNCTATGNGGAISAQTLTITNEPNAEGKYGTVFTDCMATGNGGAVRVSGDTMSITGVLFQNCQSTNEGGAVCHSDSTAAASAIGNSAFTSCFANQSGGAVSSKAETLTVEKSAFSACSASSDGGAINHTGTTTATITDTTFTDCSTTGTDTASGFGGSVYTQAKLVEVIDSSFKDSTASINGGALYCASSVEDSESTISGTSFENCSTTRQEGYGGAICSKNLTVTLNSYTPVGSSAATNTTIRNCAAPGYSGAVYMETANSTLNIKDGTVISGCYANQGGAIYLPANVTLNLTGSPEFAQNGYTTQGGAIVNATEGACIYLVEGSKINLKDSPKFSRNILPTLTRITNGGILDFVRQDIYLAGYESNIDFDTNAASIYVVGELTGDTIWVWPEQNPHRLPNEQFAKIADRVTVSPDSLSKLRNALADTVTGCSNGEYLAGVQVGTDTVNVYWDKMYLVSFMKKDNKGVAVPSAGFTLYTDADCTIPVATATSADGEEDTNAQGTLLTRGMVEFTSIRIGAYYMRETQVPLSFEENNTTYLVLVGTPYLAPNDSNRYLWEDDEGPLNVPDAATLVARHTTGAGKYYGIFPLDANGKAILRANLANNNVGIENTRDDYQAAFMKVDGSGNPLPGAAFTIYTAILDKEGQPDTFEDGYPKLMRWSRDGETYPAPVVSADGTAAFTDVNNTNTLTKGLVYFRELPLGTYYLLETAYPERNGSGRHTFYLESDRVFKLELKDPTEPLGEGTEQPEEGTGQAGEIIVTLCEWKPATESDPATYEELPKDAQNRYVVSNQEVVCKLTDANDNLLYVQGHEVWENKESSVRLFPAIYTTLEEGFNAAQTEDFVDENGQTADVSALKLKVLKDCSISATLTYDSSRDITITTAETKASKDRYVFSTNRTTETSRAELIRNIDKSKPEDALINICKENSDDNGDNSNNKPHLTLENIKLNGQESGRGIVVDRGTLTIKENTKLQDFTTSGSGAAVLMGSGTTLDINGGRNRSAVFSGNEAASANGGAVALAECNASIRNAQFTENSAVYGGAIFVDKNSELTLLNGVIRKNSAGSGSAIYGENGEAANKVVKITISGGTITGNTATDEDGGAINVGGENTKLVFGGIVTVFDNHGKLGENQQMNVVLSEDSNEIIWTTEDGLTGGRIGVYVIDRDDDDVNLFNKHGQPSNPFGTFGDSDRLNPQVFTNDRNPDLHGVAKDEKTDYIIYWSDIEGSRRVILRKVNDGYTALSGATFDIYRGNEETPYVIRTKNADGMISSESLDHSHLISKESGVFWIGDLPYGTYTIKEYTPPTGYIAREYTITVNENGVGYSTDGKTFQNELNP